MAFKTVGTSDPNNVLFNQQGVDYVLQYDSRTGGVQIIQKDAPTGTLPIYQDGNWNASATQIGLTQQQQLAYHSTVQTSIYSAYTKAGGRTKAKLPPFAQKANFGQPPGQTSSDPNANNSSQSNGSGNGLTGGISGLFNISTNLPQALTQYASNGDKFGLSNEKSLFSTTMTYPMDMNIEQQDTLQITGYRYKASKGEALFSGKARDILQNGLQTGSNLSSRVGLVILPMPNEVVDSNNVSWDGDTMNNISAALTANTMQDIGGKLVAGGIGGLFGNAGAGVMISNITQLIAQGGLTPELGLLLGPALTSKLLKMGGVGVEAESILARGAGIIPNSNMELLFNGPTLRKFTFNYRMSPRETAEASRVRRIIRFFKQSMAAKKITSTGGAAGQASFFLGTPHVFKLEYKTISKVLGGGQYIEGVNRFKTCALTSFQCNYTPDGFWAAYQEGQPVSTTMTMQFQELEPLYDTDYQQNVFSGRNDLSAVNSESVGY